MRRRYSAPRLIVLQKSMEKKKGPFALPGRWWNVITKKEKMATGTKNRNRRYYLNTARINFSQLFSSPRERHVCDVSQDPILIETLHHHPCYPRCHQRFSNLRQNRYLFQTPFSYPPHLASFFDCWKFSQLKVRLNTKIANTLPIKGNRNIVPSATSLEEAGGT